MPKHDDNGPWFVRVTHNKVAVGIYTCEIQQLSDLIDEITDPNACEYKKLPPGGFIFGGTPVLHNFMDGDYPDMDSYVFTESWIEIYERTGPWEKIRMILYSNDD